MLTKAKIASLKLRSKYFPELIFDWDEYNYNTPGFATYWYVSTLVRIERNGKWYTVHVVENCILTQGNKNTNIIEATLNRFLHAVCMVQQFYVLQGTKGEDVDHLQITEQERLNPLKNGPY